MNCSAASPVCDLASHDCRNCVKDSECDSGACDLAVGACVDPSAIRYASPSGTPADPCARLLPCSLDKASSSVDAGHPYIVLLPGIHTASASFDAQKATICGNNATIDTNVALLRASRGSSVNVRDLKLIGGNVPDYTVINNDSSEILLDGVTIDLSSGGVYAIDSNSSSSTFVRKSKIVHGFMRINGTLTIDESFLLDSSIGLIQNKNISSITNSVFVSSYEIISIEELSDSDSSGGAWIASNTFVGGSISCGTGMAASKTKYFESNILFNTVVGETMPVCHYNFNLLVPARSLGGMGNITGDPKFMNGASNDFHLRVGSSAIDAANPAPLTSNTHDYDGKPRSQGGRSDIGAFEYHP